MSDAPTLKPDLWKPRSVDDTKKVYAKWADSYDRELLGGGYHTPARVAHTLAAQISKGSTILDFGCGTGVSGQLLKTEGFRNIHGTDISPEMVEKARDKKVYSKLWVGEAGELLPPYAAIIAVGVISLGAAPPETLVYLVDQMHRDATLVFSFNDPTLKDPLYEQALQGLIDASQVALLSREYGPHLDSVDMGSDVIALRKL